MGLDMWLTRFPRYKGAKPDKIEAVADWYDYQHRPAEHKSVTFTDWCGRDKKPSEDLIKHLTPMIVHGEYGFSRISEDIGYWRKANEIHQWFVENVQDGEDDCKYHREVTEEDLSELIDVCKQVLESKDTEVAEKLLPTESGFYFGSLEYDEWYYKDLEKTIEICQNALDTTNFETQMLYYISSW